VDHLQDQLVRLGLAKLAEFGFALAGGYALQAHGLTHRLSEDIDLFTDRWNAEAFKVAVETVSAAYRDAGLRVVAAAGAETFARLLVTEPQSGRTTSVDLAADVRTHPPVALSVGPVLSERDAVAAKVAAVFSRAEARDYLDLADVMASGHYSPAELLTLGAQADAGFDRTHFAGALAAVDRFPDADFERYGVDAERVAEVRNLIHEWSRALLEPPVQARPEGVAPPAPGRRQPPDRQRPTSAAAPPDRGPSMDL
jgi:Nucleotidyl transferase AbiEii toxin, Type IV TA system